MTGRTSTGMAAPPARPLPEGHDLFVRYAFPPNELGYCGPVDSGALLRAQDPAAIAAYAREFDGTWPYLCALSDAAGIDDQLDAEVVRGYWVGGPVLSRPDPAALLSGLRDAFTGQVTGLLADLTDPTGVLAHHSFHVFVVYPWVRFLSADLPPTAPPLRILQDCRIRWGVVQSVDDHTVVMNSRPLRIVDGMLALGAPEAQTAQWRAADGTALTSRPSPGETVAAHWNWICGHLGDEHRAALDAATASTLRVVNRLRAEMCRVR